MFEQKLSQSDIYVLFGGTIPVQAISLLSQDTDTKISDVRLQLEGMAKLWRDLRKQDDVVKTEFGTWPFSTNGPVVLRTIDNHAIFVAANAEQAQSYCTMLNFGHERVLEEKRKLALLSTSNEVGLS